MKKDFLPIGTVVLLKNATKKIMITGYLPKTKGKPDEIFDYSACLFPEGIVSSNQTAVFNTDQIAEIIQTGYSNDETEQFVAALNQIVNKDNVGVEPPAEEQPVDPEQPAVLEEQQQQAEQQPEELQPEPETEKLIEDLPVVSDSLEMPTEAPQEESEPALEDPKIDDEPVPAAAPTQVEEPVQPVEQVASAPVEQEEPTPAVPSVSFNNNGAVGVESIKPFSE